jgi:flagella basal body P-ring formation protein FlgA
MVRIIFFLLAFILPAVAQVTPVTPRLKPVVTVAGELVRIGDLVENAGAAADVPIFRAPDLGMSGVVPASRVVEAVRNHQVVGLQTNGIAEVAVTRASRVIGAKEIEARLARALAGQYAVGEAKNLAFVFDREVRPLHFEPTEADLQIARLHYDRRTGRFDVNFDLPGRARSLRFTGSVVETTEIAVLARALARGDVVKASDVVIERRPKLDGAADAVANVEQAVGLATRRSLRAGHPLRQSELMKAEIVQRNEMVTLIYEVPGILLTIRGKAMESGAIGDVVNVLNIQSKRTIQGIVAGPGRVIVAGRTPHAAASIVSTAQFDSATTPPRGAE